jgi:hypothetical protein
MSLLALVLGLLAGLLGGGGAAAPGLLSLDADTPALHSFVRSPGLSSEPPAAPSPRVYRNDDFGYSLTLSPGWLMLPPVRNFDLRAVDRGATVVAGVYGVRGVRVADSTVFAEMFTYLLVQQEKKVLRLIDVPQALEVGGRRAAAWDLLHEEDATAWRIVIVPHDPGGRNTVFLTLILVTEADRAELLDPVSRTFLDGLRFFPSRPR